VIVDENYGEGNGREQAAALELRHWRAVIVKSFARIYETNGKKQGLLVLKISDTKDYDKVQLNDIVSLVRLDQLAPDKVEIENL